MINDAQQSGTGGGSRRGRHCKRREGGCASWHVDGREGVPVGMWTGGRVCQLACGRERRRQQCERLGARDGALRQRARGRYEGSKTGVVSKLGKVDGWAIITTVGTR